MSVNMDRVMKKLKEFAEKISGPASIEQVFPDRFITEFTDSKTAREFFADFGVVDQQKFDELENNPNTEALANKYIKEHSQFDCYSEFFQTAAKALAGARKEGLDLKPNPPTGDAFSDILVDIHFSVS